MPFSFSCPRAQQEIATTATVTKIANRLFILEILLME